MTGPKDRLLSHPFVPANVISGFCSRLPGFAGSVLPVPGRYFSFEPTLAVALYPFFSFLRTVYLILLYTGAYLNLR